MKLEDIACIIKNFKIELNPLTINGHPVFRKELFLSNRLYLMSKGQAEGEKELMELAETAEHEDHWTYFKDTDHWLHTEVKHSTTIDAEEGRAGMGYSSIRIKKDAARDMGLGEDIAEYHIHPDSFIDLYLKVNTKDKKDLPREFYRTLLLPYPSLKDMNSTLEVPDREYKIASPLGITTYKLHQEKLLTDEEWQDTIRDCYKETGITKESVKELLKIEGITKPEIATALVIENINKTIRDYATLHFLPRANFK